MGSDSVRSLLITVFLVAFLHTSHAEACRPVSGARNVTDLKELRGFWYEVVSSEEKNCSAITFSSIQKPGSMAFQLQSNGPKQIDILQGVATLNGPGQINLLVEDSVLPFYIAFQGRKSSGQLAYLVLAAQDNSSYFVFARSVRKFRLYRLKNVLARLEKRFQLPTLVGDFEGCTFAPKTVSQIDLEAYKGAWFQVLGNAPSLFPPVTECITAFYDIVAPGKIRLVNAGISPFGLVNITGEVEVVDPLFPSQLVVTFDSIPGAPVIEPGRYWVIDLGPIKNCEYEYAIVSSPEYNAPVFVLARDPERFAMLYQETVLDKLAELGFDMDEILFLKQGGDCEYIPEITSA